MTECVKCGNTDLKLGGEGFSFNFIPIDMIGKEDKFTSGASKYVKDYYLGNGRTLVHTEHLKIKCNKCEYRAAIPCNDAEEA